MNDQSFVKVGWKKGEPMSNIRVVVTGTGMVSPTGNNVEDSWKAAVEAKAATSAITGFDVEGMRCKIAAEVRDLDTSSVFTAKDHRRMGKYLIFTGIAAKEAMDQAGFTKDNITNKDRFGSCVGVGMGGLPEIALAAISCNEKGIRGVSPFFIPYTIPNMSAGLVAIHYELKGPNLCTATACSSGTHAIGEGYKMIRDGITDAMLVGGAESAICPLGINSFSVMKALCTDHNEDPLHASRPFDRDRSGFVMGEGAGMLVLESYEHAKKRNANILAEITGYGLSGDGYHISSPAPGGDGARRCMQAALDSAKLNADDIAYINAHGTSTKLNDAYESQAIGAVFGDHAKKLSISSTKGVTGHCLGAAGGIEGIFSVLSVSRGVIPPTANLENTDPEECPWDYTPGAARDLNVKHALSNSFGFGGTNASIIVSKFEG